jgi:hypothetical protein
MKLYIWEDVSHVSSSWHDEGGVVVIAEDLDAARSKVRDYCAQFLPEEGEERGVLLATVDADLAKDPGAALVVDPATEPRLWVFPNAGCC